MENNTVTQVDTKTVTDNEILNEEITVEAPLFILFAEYLGYVSKFNKVAEEWCDGKVPDEYIQKVIILEANCILRQMKKDYSIEDIRDFYMMYYPLIFEDYDEKLKKLLEN